MPDYRALAQRPEVRAFLDVVARGEVLPNLTREQEYRQQVGGGFIDSFADHPRETIWIGSLGVHSTAAGRYQFLARTWDEAAAAVGAWDFSPEWQDAAATYLIKRRGVLDDLLDGNLDAVLEKASYEWASLPAPDGGSRYGQWVPHDRGEVVDFYAERLEHYGGTPAPSGGPSSAPLASIPVKGPALIAGGLALLYSLGKAVKRYA